MLYSASIEDIPSIRDALVTSLYKTLESLAPNILRNPQHICWGGFLGHPCLSSRSLSTNGSTYAHAHGLYRASARGHASRRPCARGYAHVYFLCGNTSVFTSPFPII